MIEIIKKYSLNGNEFYNGRELETVLKNDLSKALGDFGNEDLASFLLNNADKLAPILSDLVTLHKLRMEEAKDRILASAKSINW